MQVGPGVRDLSENDVVLPTSPLLGTFSEATVVKAKQVVRVGRLAASAAASASAGAHTTPLAGQANTGADGTSQWGYF